jgi:hypothetical protein
MKAKSVERIYRECPFCPALRKGERPQMIRPTQTACHYCDSRLERARTAVSDRIGPNRRRPSR